MILKIDDLIIPETLSGNIERFNADIDVRTVSMRLIRKMSINEKWRATLNYEGRTMPIEYLRALYAKCKDMRKNPKPVTFISPYDSLQYTVSMFCTQPFPPKLLHIYQGTPMWYSNIGAVFEEA